MTTTATLPLAPLTHPTGLLARLLSPWLDSRIAAGVAPTSSRLLATRAGQLVDPRERRLLADGYENLLARAAEPIFVVDSRLPVPRRAVQAAEAEIRAVAAVLRAPSPLSARQVVAARTLLCDGTGPVRTGRGLRATVARLVDELSHVDG